jgi:hypothetical protein
MFRLRAIDIKQKIANELGGKEKPRTTSVLLRPNIISGSITNKYV